MSQSGMRARRVLEIATDRSLLQWPAVMMVIFVSTLLHLVSSVDLGLTNLPIRLPLAIVSVLPLFPLVALSHIVADAVPHARTGLVLLAYMIGGAVRGALLDLELRRTDVQAAVVPHFRIVSGVVLVTMTALIINYAWSTFARARVVLTDLQQETRALAHAVRELREQSEAQDADRLMGLSTLITDTLGQMAHVETRAQERQLQELVDDVVRPMSRDFARQVAVWSPDSSTPPRVTARSIWQSLDPLRHLPAPALGVAFSIFAAGTSLVAVFGWRTAVSMLAAVSVTLTASMVGVYAVARRWLVTVQRPWRDVLITVGLLAIALPSALTTTVILRGSPMQYAYVAPGLVFIPIFGWIIMIGNSALDRVRIVTAQLGTTRDQLRWSIARINLLSWYRQGMVSRLLHGPIQNNIQVGLLRIRAANDESDTSPILIDIVARIDIAIREAFDAKTAAGSEIRAMHDVVDTWAAVARVSLHVTPECERALNSDLAASSILVDIMQEACSNAIRHGRARNVQIECRLAPQLVHISIIDDGRPFDGPTSGHGLGTQFLEACSMSLRRERDGSRNELHLSIPLGATAATRAGDVQFAAITVA